MLGKKEVDMVKEKRKLVKQIMRDVDEKHEQFSNAVIEKTFLPPGRDFAIVPIDYMTRAAVTPWIDKILEVELTPHEFNRELGHADNDDAMPVWVLKDLMKDELKGEKLEKAKYLGWIEKGRMRKSKHP